MSLTKKQWGMLIAALVAGLPFFVLRIIGETNTEGVAAALGGYSGGFLWGFILAKLVNIFKKESVNAINWTIYGGLIVNFVQLFSFISVLLQV